MACESGFTTGVAGPWICNCGHVTCFSLKTCLRSL
jgi:hypothetical protein